MVDETDFKFDDKLRQQIHYDWGMYYKRIGKNESARKQFLDSLSLKENAHGPMEQLSKCYLERGDALTALDYANQCLKNHPKITREKYHRNECIYDGNEFEKCLVERYKMWHENKTSLGAVDATKLTELTLEKSMGHEIGSFLNNFRDAIYELDKIKSEETESRPVWKFRREKGECDVVSVCSNSKELTQLRPSDHPIDLCRSRRKKKISRSMYFSTPTIATYEFLNNLTNDSRLNFSRYEESTKIIKNAIEDELDIFKEFELMLRQRQPIYAKKAVQCKRNNKKFNYSSLLKMQETTQRQAAKQLQRVQKLKKTDFSGLLIFVEDIMTNFYLIKTVKVFPKKLDLLETIYNIVGIGYIDEIKTPPPDTPNNVYSLFNSAFSGHYQFVTPKKFVTEPGFNKPSDHFLKRLQYSKIPLEHCYIFHHLSRLYFDEEKYIESKETGQELIKISSSLNNYVWMLLGYLRVMLVDASLGEFESVRDNLENVRKWNEKINGRIWSFLEKSLSAVQEEMNFNS